MVTTIADALMSAEVGALCSPECGRVSDEVVNRRNGYRLRKWDTKVGTVGPAIPKPRKRGLLPARHRAEQALVPVVATAYPRSDPASPSPTAFVPAGREGDRRLHQ
ncbi:hypothetical protein E4K10_46525 [Streptomyces sp. T1317-0309]|nr:hypothetical protein E4K10_46525 [Streptomyces sp. T1317-0309]